MDRVDSLDRLAMTIRRSQVVNDANAFDDQDLLLELDFANSVSGQLFDLDLARYQRAGKSARQSARRRRDDVVERRRMRLVSICTDAVVFCDSAMEPKPDRFLLSWQPSQPNRSSFTFNAHFRPVNDVTHCCSPDRQFRFDSGHRKFEARRRCRAAIVGESASTRLCDRAGEPIQSCG